MIPADIDHAAGNRRRTTPPSNTSTKKLSGPGRFARAAYKIREGGPHERALSFVALDKGDRRSPRCA